MAHSHHSHPSTHSGKHVRQALWVAVLFMLIEVAGGFASNSLALITDALHLFTDIGSLLLALLIIRIIALPRNPKMSYGYYRAEILGALFSAFFLLALCFFVIYSAILRFLHPKPVTGELVFIIALVGFLANLWMMRILHPIHDYDLNTKTAYLHVLGDLLGSAGVILGGILMWITHWNFIDPLITLLFTLFLCWNTLPIIKRSVRILMQGTPEEFDPETIEKALKTIPGVQEVHDLHLWSISSRRVALSTHLIVAAPANHSVLQAAHQFIEKQYHIQHMTIQVEEANQFESRFCYDIGTCR